MNINDVYVTVTTFGKYTPRPEATVQGIRFWTMRLMPSDTGHAKRCGFPKDENFLASHRFLRYRPQYLTQTGKKWAQILFLWLSDI